MIIFLLIGLGLVLYGLITISSRRKIVPLSQVITGKVIDLRETHVRKGRPAYFPLIEYYNPHTGTVESYLHEAGGGRTTYLVGDAVELLFYSDADRKLVLINSWSGKWLAPIAFIVGGVIFTAFGVLMSLY